MQNQHEAPVGPQHYSGRNRIPNIQEFVAQLDKEKKERDAAIDDEAKHPQATDAQPHKPDRTHHSKKKTKTVRDPVTGKDVEIENAKTDYKEAVENPQVRPSPSEETWPV